MFIFHTLLTPTIDFIKKIEDDNALAINFHGGEPLLNFEAIKKIVAQSKLENIFANFSLTTNLLLMNNEMNDIKRIDKNNRGTYKKVIKKLNILKKYNIPFRTRMTVTPFTINYLYESVTHLINIGCKEIAAAPDLFCQHWDEEKISQLSLQLDLIYDFILKYKMYFTVMFLLSLFTCGATYITPLINATIIDQGINDKNGFILACSVSSLFLLYLILEIISLLSFHLRNKTNFVIKKEIENQVLDYCFEKGRLIVSSGEIDTIIKRDVPCYISFICNFFIDIVKNICSVLFV